ncbi:sulfotransferase family protein [bacterium]|nr:sulfotransferase family protein [bacterium]
MTLRVIGAGFGRTGTSSMKLALQTLGLGPCHHMKVLLDDPAQQALWNGFVAGQTPDWDQAFAGFNSAVDWPSAYYWQSLARHYPDAKVLLTLRSPESWWESYSKTILTHVNRTRGTGSWIDEVICKTVMRGQPEDRATALAAFNANTAAVRAAIPADRLIVHEAGDGWGPLCKGLDLPEPAEPYPHVFTTAEFLAQHAARMAAAAQGN